MASVNITRRKRSKEWARKRGTQSLYAYQVRYRAGGRYTKLVDAGTFPTRRAADDRARFVLLELAAGRDPLEAIRRPSTPPSQRIGLGAMWDQWAERRAVNADPATLRSYSSARAALIPLLGERTDPAAVTVDHVQAAVTEAMGTLSAGTIRKYLGSLKMVLDFCDVVPNPVQSPKLEKPTVVREQINPPTSDEVKAILEHLEVPRTLALEPDDLVLLFTLVECLGLRCAEVLSLTRADVDVPRQRILVHGKRTSGGQPRLRWVPVPEELLAALVRRVDGTPADRRVFPALTTGQVRRIMEKACIAAGISHYHPHELRHRRISLWFDYGFQPIQVAAWAGHSKPSMGTDTYGHVLVSADDPWRVFWHAEYNRLRGLPMLRPAGETEAMQA